MRAFNLLYEFVAYDKSSKLTSNWDSLDSFLDVLPSACTSIMSYNTLTDTILSGRNMDFRPQTSLEPITIDLEFFSDENTLAYRGTTFFGLTGLWTAMKPYAFSIFMNQRDYGEREDNLLTMQWASQQSRFTGKDSSIMPVAMAARRAIENCLDYKASPKKPLVVGM